MKLKRQTLRTVQGSLLLACVLFVGTTVYELVRPYPVTPATALLNQETPALTGMGATTERDVSPLSTFSEIVERPLFREDRRPYEPETPAEPEQTSDTGPDITDQISLSAVVIDENERIALIKRRQGKKLQQLRQGDKFNGWTVNHIRADDITMQKGQETRQIALMVTSSQPASKESQNEPETMPVNPEEKAGKPARRKPAPRQ